MHLMMILITMGIAVWIRLCFSQKQGTWTERWQHTLIVFLFPTLLLITTSATILGMGHHGTMLGRSVGWLGCLISLSLLSYSVGLLCYRFWMVRQSLQKISTYPLVLVAGYPSRVIEIPTLFAAQVGFWRSELIISQGLLKTLKSDQIKAVLNHEQAHAYYRDTFLFFWLGWIHQLTFWLPKTQDLWQELLLLRELRADRWAAQEVDALILAESLVRVVQHSLGSTEINHVAFSEIQSPLRLEERIQSLLNQPEIRDQEELDPHFNWVWFLLTFLPLVMIPLHIQD